MAKIIPFPTQPKPKPKKRLFEIVTLKYHTRTCFAMQETVLYQTMDLRILGASVLSWDKEIAGIGAADDYGIVGTVRVPRDQFWSIINGFTADH